MDNSLDNLDNLDNSLDNLNNLKIEELLELKQKISILIKEKSSECIELKKKWKIRKKIIDDNLLFIRKLNSLQVAKRKKLQFENIEEVPHFVPNCILNKLEVVEKLSDANIYISIFPSTGFDNEIADIVYVGETRKSATGLIYRSIIKRWGYGSGDHGGQVRMVFRKQQHIDECKTRIDSYFYSFNFLLEKGYVFITKGKESEIINELRKELKKTNCILVNKI